MAADPEVWQPESQRWGLDGNSWTLTRPSASGPETVYQWMPPAAPFLEFCFEVLRAAELRLEIKRSEHWDYEWPD